MTTQDEMEKVRIELREVFADMKGLNPNTSVYKKLKERADALQVRLSSMGGQRNIKTV